MTPPPDRRSTPGAARSLSDLYPVALDSDPKELAQQSSTLFTQHARAHDRHVAHFSAFNQRLASTEGDMQEVKKKVGDLEDVVTKSLNGIKEVMVAGFADVNLERTKDRTKQSTAFLAVVVGWTLFTSLCAAAAWYLSRPSCKPDEAMIGDRCVQVTTVVTKPEVK